MFFGWLTERRRQRIEAEPFSPDWERVLQRNVAVYPESVNVYDSLDVVARAQPVLKPTFRRLGQELVLDVNEQNWGSWRHAATKYFQGPELRRHLRVLCDREDS